MTHQTQLADRTRSLDRYCLNFSFLTPTPEPIAQILTTIPNQYAHKKTILGSPIQTISPHPNQSAHKKTISLQSSQPFSPSLLIPTPPKRILSITQNISNPALPNLSFLSRPSHSPNFLSPFSRYPSIFSMTAALPAYAVALKRRRQSQHFISLNSPRLSNDDSFPDSSAPEDFDPPSPSRAFPDELSQLRNSNSDLQRELAQLRRELRNEKDEAARLKQSFEAAERKIEELTSLLKTKDASLSSLQFAYETLEDDFRGLADVHAANSESLRLRQLEIQRLQLELENFRGNSNRRYYPVMEAPRVSYRPVVQESPPPKVERGEEEIPLSELNEDQLRNRLDVLSREKAERERLLNHAAPRGAKLAQVRIRKQELEEEAIKLGALVSKVRLEMRRRQIL
jgi:hypothetical protein